MDPASLGLAVAGVLELCFKYGNKLLLLCRQYRSLDAELGETLLTIQASWIKMDIQLRTLRSLSSKLDTVLLTLYHDALTRLEAKLSKAADSFQVLQAKAGMAYNVHQKLKVVYLKRELSQMVEEFENWQRRFDPSWYLISRIADPGVDGELKDVAGRSKQVPGLDFNTQQPSSGSSPSLLLARMRESIKQIESQGAETSESVFKDAAALCTDIVKIQGTNAYLARYKNTKRHVLLDPANRLAIGNKSQSQISPATAKLNIRDLARLLQHIDSSTFHLLRCAGVVEISTEQGAQFHLLLELPAPLQTSTPRTLRTLLSQTPKCSLTQRIKLAQQLARSVMFVHASGFVHKNIRPETILTFPSANPAASNATCNMDIDPSFLIGFELFRRAEGRTDKFGDLDWSKNLYRHPLRQGLYPEYLFEMRHDVYSLGVCLLEVAMWESFVQSSDQLLNKDQSHYKDSENETDSDLPWPGLGIEVALHEKDARRAAFIVKDRLVEMTKEVLPALVGDRYTGVVIACLCCLDDGDDNTFRDAKGLGLQDRDGIIVGVRYIENVSFDH
ncbi:uncharacterized protein BDV14DRAFT_203613 [Aspergillus stella-maris]|uniref:uncharacterized protein n=1 Tax=Aspergillus stella-maris TaxID=1810926 RepID=UPI003CCD3D43